MEGDALRILYERYRKELLIYLYSLCKNRAQAEDLLQETFLKALIALPRGHANIRAWLYMVARNLAFNSIRSGRKLVLQEEIDRAQEEAAPIDAVICTERNRMLYTCLLQLEERKREVLTLQYFGGLSQKEIAAVLHLTPENVRVLAYRAKKELRKRMEENGCDLS